MARGSATSNCNQFCDVNLAILTLRRHLNNRLSVRERPERNALVALQRLQKRGPPLLQALIDVMATIGLYHGLAIDVLAH